ncbi:MAG: hypothetical protein US55_C0014G0004 [Candidatus Levybacteria bacterium GW2011_GWC2_37_7]|nr:MAG: hypothetical protein US55_C0014G0004 [Candidatus Levybacteria bacterium GW2011_GWC2_37_7]
MNESKRNVDNSRQWEKWRVSGAIGSGATKLPKFYGFTTESIKADVAKLEAKKHRGIGAGAANRRFERFMMGINPSFRLDALRPDQKGSYYPHEQEQFRQEDEPLEVGPGDKLIATITFKPDEGKVVIQRLDEPPVEE